MNPAVTTASVAGVALAGLGLVSILASARAPAAAPAPAAAAVTYTIDPVHSTVLWRANHLGVSYTYGRFNAVEGLFTLDEAAPAQCQVSVRVRTESIDSNDKSRDDHLRSPDFLDVKQFPVATFESTSARKSGDKTWAVTGRFTLHGVTKEVALTMEHVGTATDPRAGQRAGFHGVLAIKQSDYGMKYMADASGGKHDEIQLTISIEGVKE